MATEEIERLDLATSDEHNQIHCQICCVVSFVVTFVTFHFVCRIIQPPDVVDIRLWIYGGAPKKRPKFFSYRPRDGF